MNVNLVLAFKQFKNSVIAKFISIPSLSFHESGKDSFSLLCLLNMPNVAGLKVTQILSFPESSVLLILIMVSKIFYLSRSQPSTSISSLLLLAFNTEGVLPKWSIVAWVILECENLNTIPYEVIALRTMLMIFGPSSSSIPDFCILTSILSKQRGYLVIRALICSMMSRGGLKFGTFQLIHKSSWPFA